MFKHIYTHMKVLLSRCVQQGQGAGVVPFASIAKTCVVITIPALQASWDARQGQSAQDMPLACARTVVEGTCILNSQHIMLLHL